MDFVNEGWLVKVGAGRATIYRAAAYEPGHPGYKPPIVVTPPPLPLRIVAHTPEVVVDATYNATVGKTTSTGPERAEAAK
jgi:hypothetical protein